jgi:hypothetical protein
MQLLAGCNDHAYNPSYFRGKDKEDCSTKLAGHKVSKTPILINKPGWWCTCDPSYARDCK